MVPIKKKLANRENYGAARSTSKIQWIVIHYTANDGDTDEGNGTYFANNVVKTSAHYFVDDDSITQSVPDNFVAYHCGTKKAYKHPECRNGNSIGIEICDDVKNGIVYPSQKTIDNALELTRHLTQKYNVPITHIIRHYDVTGKLCPAYWVDDAKWEKEFKGKIEDMTKEEVIKIIQEYEAQKAKKPVDSWAKSAWEKAKKKGVMDGTAPKSHATREQIAAILDRLGLL